MSFYIFHPLWLLSCRGLFSSEEETEKEGLGGRWDVEGQVRGTEGRETVVGMCCVREEYIFS